MRVTVGLEIFGIASGLSAFRPAHLLLHCWRGRPCSFA
jgi:hypothetical protein